MDEATKTLINDWFQTREIVDDTYFELYFKRVLNRDYGRYEQILRLEPELQTTEYEWLVEDYLNTDTTHSGSNTQNNTGKNILTHGLTTDETNNISHTGTVEHKHTQDEATNYDNETGSSSGNTSENTTRTDNLSESTNSSSDTLIKQGYKDNQINFNKSNPVSISYTDEQINSALTGGQYGVPTPDWHYASGQTQQYNEHIITGSEPDNVTTKNTKSNTGTQSSESSSESSGNTNSKKGYNRNETTTDTYNENTNETKSITNSGDDITNTTSNITGNDSSTGNENKQGRHTEISQLLDRAVSFIAKTSAWEWLESRLEVCFMGVYDI